MLYKQGARHEKWTYHTSYLTKGITGNSGGLQLILCSTGDLCDGPSFPQPKWVCSMVGRNEKRYKCLYLWASAFRKSQHEAPLQTPELHLPFTFSAHFQRSNIYHRKKFEHRHLRHRSRFNRNTNRCDPDCGLSIIHVSPNANIFIQKSPPHQFNLDKNISINNCNCIACDSRRQHKLLGHPKPLHHFNLLQLQHNGFFNASTSITESISVTTHGL